jgi:hypothetical protein
MAEVEGMLSNPSDSFVQPYLRLGVRLTVQLDGPTLLFFLAMAHFLFYKHTSYFISTLPIL